MRSDAPKAVTRPASLQRLRRRSVFQRVFGHLLAVLLLGFATPGSAEVVEETLSWVTGMDSPCCTDPCGASGHESAPDDCGGSCSHCGCCASMFTLGTPPIVPTGQPLEQTPVYGVHACAPYASGFRTTPFRPPSV